MKILLPWEVSNKEESLLKDSLSEHEVDVVKTTDPKFLLDNYDLSEIEILISGIASKEVLSAAPKLEYIQSMISAFGAIDLDYAESRDLIVSSVKGANSGIISEHALFLILSVFKNAKKYQDDVLSGVWDKTYNDNLEGKTLGIIGFGNLGRSVARRILPFDVKVIANRYHPDKGNYGLDVEIIGGRESMGELMSRSDIVLVTVPKTPYNMNLVNSTNLGNMKKDAYLINISRGPIVNEQDIYTFLKDGKIRSFATDVFPKEPNDFSHPLYNLPNVYCTPHVAANTIESKLKCMQSVVDNIKRYVKGEELPNKVDFGLGY